MRVLSIVHADSDPPGLFEVVASDLGHHHEEWRVDLAPEPPARLDSFGAVGVFGGYMDPCDDDRLGWLRAEKDMLRSLVGRVPAIGICLGAQLLAEAAGGGIHPAEHPEIGWSDIEILPAASSDPLFADLSDERTVFEWHSWTFDLPAGAVPLARSNGGLQAYRLDPTTWGIQFHAEVTADKLAEWLDHAATDEVARRVNVDPVRERERSLRFLRASTDLGRRLFARFLDHAERHRSPSGTGGVLGAGPR